MQGIYFLYNENSLTYIGKTKYRERRLKAHLKIGRIFDSYRFLPVDNLSDMAILELSYIDMYKPVENKLDKFESTSSINIELIDIAALPLNAAPNLPKTEEMRLYWVKKLNDALENVIASNKDFKIVNYMLSNQSSLGYVKNSSAKPASIDYIAKKYEVSNRKVSGIISKMIKENIAMKDGRTIYLNPYMILPYGNTEEFNYLLQLKWDTKYELSEEELMEVYSSETTTDRTLEV